MSKKEIKSKAEEVKKTEETSEASTDTAAKTEEAVEETKEASKAEETKTEEASDSKEAKKDPKDLKIAELTDRVQRQMAEFDNFRKRTEKEKSAMFEMGASDIIKKLLPVIDNFERGFKSVSDEELETPFAKGMDMVYKQFLKLLEDADVKPIEAVGNEFNPDLHNAVMHVDDESVGENIIVEEFEKGYTYRDSVIRHSMVKVAN
ncbi:nucleotide exchange factor GrpE [Lachnospira pectinoschiza]|uniref:Protein GrpE n=1 Tax=Lachnospira pectinoschiza TaxID=28052 RepID=A0A1G9YB37_9FIRM|nr:nucleotide exchange factor GrpE [Lachnospira pectinoschiza]SDN06298.1 molecular chaperone GrpE [Lachnospira pectinoschiza]